MKNSKYPMKQIPCHMLFDEKCYVKVNKIKILPSEEHYESDTLETAL